MKGVDKRATPANALKTYAEHELNAAGWHVFRVNAGYGGRHSTKQAPDFTPDIIGYAPTGVYVGLEVKIGRDKVSKGQLAELRRIQSSQHGLADILRTESDVKRIIEMWPAWLPDAEVIDFNDENTEI